MTLYDNKNVLARRLRFFRRDPHCYWCGVRTELNAEGKSNHATVDHLYSKLHPMRPAYHKAGSDRTAVLHVLACAKCNGERGLADVLGCVFVPKLESRCEMAKMASAAMGEKTLDDYYLEVSEKQRQKIVVANQPRAKTRKPERKAPTKRALMPDDVRGFGWTDINGDLRPRSWEEYCSHYGAFIGAAFEPRVKLKRPTLCTIGEIMQYRQGGEQP